ncbi:hypothetical protein CYMTET_56754 [Cymbomonas tetramitiformis]|uniref:beta-galactoside alpha-(2,6)-sialyltransferase n=1 Tax=Cymbomonas tetramitiformis TaxID=36881 RepID=A0AAE0BBJ5_9CHLO|nr:hypothetical protein CYMTET_56754 [Cymbomonas tetramitiformis]
MTDVPRKIRKSLLSSSTLRRLICALLLLPRGWGKTNGRPCAAIFQGAGCTQAVATLPACVGTVFPGKWFTLTAGAVEDRSTGKVKTADGRQSALKVPANLLSKLPERDIFGGLSLPVRSCAVVSNSFELTKHRYGKEIDQHDLVLRFNNAPTKGMEEIVGTKTTIRLTNSAYQGFREKDEEAVASKFCKSSEGDCMQELTRLLDKKVHPVNMEFFDYAQTPYFRAHDTTPTSGFVSMLLLLHKCQSVSMFGFAAEELKKWYFHKRVGNKALPKSKWLREKAWVIEAWKYADSGYSSEHQERLQSNASIMTTTSSHRTKPAVPAKKKKKEPPEPTKNHPAGRPFTLNEKSSTALGAKQIEVSNKKPPTAPTRPPHSNSAKKPPTAPTQPPGSNTARSLRLPYDRHTDSAKNNSAKKPPTTPTQPHPHQRPRPPAPLRQGRSLLGHNSHYEHACLESLQKDISSTGRFRKWTRKSLREIDFGGKASRFVATAKDVGKFGRLLVLLRQELSSAGSDVLCFDLADMSKEVLECVNELLYDTLADLIELLSVADLHFQSCEDSSERDGRQAVRLYSTWRRGACPVACDDPPRRSTRLCGTPRV